MAFRALSDEDPSHDGVEVDDVGGGGIKEDPGDGLEKGVESIEDLEEKEDSADEEEPDEM